MLPNIPQQLAGHVRNLICPSPYSDLSHLKSWPNCPITARQADLPTPAPNLT